MLSKLEVEESIIVECARIAEGRSSFQLILNEGLSMKEAGLSPVYLYDSVEGVLEVTSREKIDRRLS